MANVGKKMIMLSQRVDWENAYHERRDALDQRWAELLNELELLMVPAANQPEMLSAVLERLSPDGIILTGGASPAAYGGLAPERDGCDERLIAYACQNKIPLLGVCRGMQSIVLYFGGTLKLVNGHRAVRHPLQLTQDGIAKPWSEVTEANSYHELAVSDLGEQLLPLLYAEDGTIEAIRHQTLPIYGMMWHPERENPFRPQDLAIIKQMFDL